MDRKQAVDFLCQRPAELGHLIGFTKLERLHNDWIREMVLGHEDFTLQAHRGSYKTTCVSIALAEIIAFFPNQHTMFLRKTDTDTKEITKQVQTILTKPQFQYLMTIVYGKEIRLVTSTQSEITTNYYAGVSGTPQLYSCGIGGSITGKHYDRIFTDDIVNLEDRFSRAERERTKLAYQELENIKNRDGRIINTGTPWHKEDAFTLMPNIKRFDCYTTGLITEEELNAIRPKMTASLFAANYELKHIASDEQLFTDAVIIDEPANVLHGIAHIDAAYGGADYTALTICKRKEDKYYLFGKLWHKHVDDCEDEILELCDRYLAGKIYCEDNGDKGYLAKELRKRGRTVINYHEDTNKYVKITSYLKATWKDVSFIAGTDAEYINQICDYTEHAEHDDAPDSAASIVRILWKQKTSTYKPIYM